MLMGFPMPSPCPAPASPLCLPLTLFTCQCVPKTFCLGLRSLCFSHPCLALNFFSFVAIDCEAFSPSSSFSPDPSSHCDGFISGIHYMWLKLIKAIQIGLLVSPISLSLKALYPAIITICQTKRSFPITF